MQKLFIPTDRVGLQSIQKSISGTFMAVNQLVKAGVNVSWYVRPLYFEKTEKWPEGHQYQNGFAVDDNTKTRDILNNGSMFYEAVKMVPSVGCQLKRCRVALYNGRGAGEDFSAPLVDVLKSGGFAFEYIGDKEIRGGQLAYFDLLIVPGSPDAGECYYAGLGNRGYDQVRSFVADRGNYLGVCGGAYLPLTSYSTKNHFWLDLVEATDTEDLDYWRSGSGFVRCRIEDDSHPLFTSIALGTSSTMNLVYWEGPSITIKGSNVKSLAKFENLLACGREPLRPFWDMQDNKMAAEASLNWYNPLTQELFDKFLSQKTAFAEAVYKNHRILMYSPHPEMGNIGYGPRKDSLNFLLIYNGLTYLSTI